MKAHSQAGLTGRSRPASEVTAFFTRLTNEQARYLESLTELRQLIDSGPGQLAKVAAQQARLAQQFLDAQRSIIRVRADVDAEVAGIDEDSAVEIEALLAEFDLDADCDALRSLEWGHQTALTQLAGVGASSGTRPGMADVEVMSVAGLVDAAFEPLDTQGLAAQYQLRSLLDDWWRAEVQEGQASVDDAHARAAVRLYTVQRRAALMTASSDEATVDFEVEVDSHGVQLPDALHDVLSFVDAAFAGNADGMEGDLEALLVALTESLADPTPESSEQEISALLGPASATDVTEAKIASPERTAEEAFDRFWGSRHGERGRRSVPERIFKDVLLPALFLMSLVALVLAWIG